MLICLIMLCIYLIIHYLFSLILTKNEGQWLLLVILLVFLWKTITKIILDNNSCGPLAKGLKDSQLHLFSITHWLTKTVFWYYYSSVFCEQRLDAEDKDTCHHLFVCLGLQLRPKALEYPVVVPLKLHIMGLFIV